MTALTLLQQLHALGVTLTPYPDGTLRYKAPKGVLTDALRVEIRTHKAALHDLVEDFEERAAIAEYCGGFSRAEAECLAWVCVLGGGNAPVGHAGSVGSFTRAAIDRC